MLPPKDIPFTLIFLFPSLLLLTLGMLNEQRGNAFHLISYSISSDLKGHIFIELHILALFSRFFTEE